MPKRKEPELTPAEQKKRFEALAREVGADTSAKGLRRAIEQVGRAKPPPRQRQRKK